MYGEPRRANYNLTLSVTAILDDAFQLIRQRFGLLFGISALIIVPITLLSAFLSRGAMSDYTKHVSKLKDLTDRVQQGLSVSDARMSDAVVAVAKDGVKLLAIVGTLSVLQYGLLGCALTVAVCDGFVQRQTSLARSYRAVAHRLWPLLGSLVVMIGLLLAVVALPAGLAAAAGAAGLAIVLLLASLFVGVFLAVRLSLVMQVVVLEGRGVGSLKRSYRLTRGYFWKTFGLLGLTSVMVALMVNLTDTIVLHFSGNNQAINTLVNLLISTATTPLVLCAQTLLFLNLKMKKEEYSPADLIADLDRLP
jgi:hypothetical protein